MAGKNVTSKKTGGVQWLSFDDALAQNQGPDTSQFAEAYAEKVLGESLAHNSGLGKANGENGEYKPAYVKETADNYVSTSDMRLYRDGNAAYEWLERYCEGAGIDWQKQSIDDYLADYRVFFGGRQMLDLPVDIQGGFKLWFATEQAGKRYPEVENVRHMLAQYLKAWAARWEAAMTEGQKKRDSNGILPGGQKGTLSDYVKGLTTAESIDTELFPEYLINDGKDYGAQKNGDRDSNRKALIMAAMRQIYTNGFDPEHPYSSDEALDKLCVELAQFYGKELDVFQRTGTMPSTLDGEIRVREQGLKFMQDLLQLTASAGSSAAVQKRSDIAAAITKAQAELEELKNRKLARDAQQDTDTGLLTGGPLGETAKQQKQREKAEKKAAKQQQKIDNVTAGRKR